MAIEFEGLDEILDSLDKLADTQQLNDTMGQVCALVERDAKQNAPKDTGALARSIESKVENNNNSIQGVVFTPLEYAPYRYVRSLNRAKSGKPKQLNHEEHMKLHWQSRGN